MSTLARCWILAVLLLVPTVASAQERGDVGVFMGYPNLGFIWHVSDKIAIRPEIDFSFSDNEIDSSFGNSSDATSWNVEFGASALLYLNSADRLRTYVAPQFSYARASTDSGSNILGGLVGNTYGFAGLFGAQYSLNDRFSVFGELGLGYSHISSESDLTGRTGTSSNVSLRRGVGVILYF